MKNNRSEKISKFEETDKPKLILPIFYTLIFIAPYGHLWLDIIEKKYERLVLLASFSGIGLIIVSSIWTLYFVRRYRLFR
ncbi:hypothetical protein [Clostridium sp. ZS2-4]|uniref:hypothetical protein n=1 Tax=Clostridium sp. ZS2-4 TaxID=2987703 RepID=UPI00227A9A01|nr:hypothetical protein [Clostridium sp. ZS2-4]MCY6353779.1 hypothetical protein [Clostridium sp. ZS2-4]